jgi:hypothetical protein
MECFIPESIIQSMGAASKPNSSKNWPLPSITKGRRQKAVGLCPCVAGRRQKWKRELANLDHWQFSQLLGERKIPRHYSETELAEDLDYARCQ